jgi:hypothetical protein
MLTASFLLLASEPLRVTRSQFVEQASACGVPLYYEPRGEVGYAAFLSVDGQALYLRDDQPKAKVECMHSWAERRGILIIYRRN